MQQGRLPTSRHGEAGTTSSLTSKWEKGLLGILVCCETKVKPLARTPRARSTRPLNGSPVLAVLSHFGRFGLPVTLANGTAPSGNNLQPRSEITLPNDRLTGDSSSPTGEEPYASAQHPGPCHTFHLPGSPWEPSQGRRLLPGLAVLTPCGFTGQV